MSLLCGFGFDLEIMLYLATILTAILGAVICHLVYALLLYSYQLKSSELCRLMANSELWSEIWPKNEYSEQYCELAIDDKPILIYIIHVFIHLLNVTINVLPIDVHRRQSVTIGADVSLCLSLGVTSY